MYAGSMTRNSKNRAITIINNTNQSIDILVGFYDSIIGNNGVAWSGNSANYKLASNSGVTLGATATADINAALDSFFVQTYYDSVIGTLGNINIWLVEVM